MELESRADLSRNAGERIGADQGRGIPPPLASAKVVLPLGSLKVQLASKPLASAAPTIRTSQPKNMNTVARRNMVIGSSEKNVKRSIAEPYGRFSLPRTLRRCLAIANYALPVTVPKSITCFSLVFLLFQRRPSPRSEGERSPDRATESRRLAVAARPRDTFAGSTHRCRQNRFPVYSARAVCREG